MLKKKLNMVQKKKIESENICHGPLGVPGPYLENHCSNHCDAYRTCVEINSLVKALLTGARSVYSVFGPMRAAKPSSDTMSLKVLWESPISSIPSLADMNHNKTMLVITEQ